MDIENSNLEFKRELTNEIKNTVVAFANTLGEIIKIGIGDDGTISGVENIDDTLTRLTNTIRDSILPDITMFVNYSVTEDRVIIVNVNEGTNKPYFLKDKGMKPSGIYVRQGASTAQTSWDQIRTMIKLTDGDRYETRRSFEQNLTFDFAKTEFERNNIPFDESKFTSLGIMNNDKTFSNLGLLISDQCQHTIKIAVFDSTEKNTFLDRKEINGSLFKQLREAYTYLDLNNKKHTTFAGIDRIDKRDYSEMVVREALVNAIVHREYSFSGSIIINIYSDRMEFISLGGLYGGISENDIMSGISQTRNEKLANIFYRLKHIESYGYGIPKIFSDYKNYDIKPKIKVTENAFVITIPNKNFVMNSMSESKNSTPSENNVQTNSKNGDSKANLNLNIDPYAPKEYITSNLYLNDVQTTAKEVYITKPMIANTLKKYEKAVIEYIRSNGFITRAIVEKKLEIKQSRAYQIIREMQRDKLIVPSENDKRNFVLTDAIGRAG